MCSTLLPPPLLLSLSRSPLLPSSHRSHTGALLISFLSDLVSHSCFFSFFSSFSCAVMAVSPFPHSSFSFSHQSCRICMWVQEKIHRGSHFPVSSELLPSFLLTFLSLLWECFLSEIKVSYEPISHIPAKHTHTYTYTYTGIVTAAPVQATVKEQKYTNTETIDFSVIKQTHTSVCWRSVCSRRTIRTQSHISTLPLSIEQVRETKVEMRGKTE